MSTPAQQAPVCYRHPERETYIRCTRCERSICPDCMTPAAVGFHCPECVASGRAAVRAPRTALGGRIASGAVVTKTLIGVTIACFVLQYLYGYDRSVEDFALLGLATGSDGGIIGVASGEYYRLITAAFMHGGLLHLAFNMYVLFVLGPPLETVLGRARMLVLYLLSALGGSVASYAFSEPFVPSVGASGAIFGLMGATLVVGRRLRADVTNVVVLIAINIAIGLVVPNIDWRAHVGGLAAGALVGGVFAYLPRAAPAATGGGVVQGAAAGDPRRRALIQGAALAAFTLVLVLAMVWRTGVLRSDLLGL